MVARAEQLAVDRFTDRFDLCCHPVRLAVEARALGVEYGSTGYTTRAQADRIARALRLGPGVRLADIGAGSGWPGAYLAATTGCRVVSTDLPVDGLERARRRAAQDGADLAPAVATGKRQPVRSGAFDAVIHTDVLCCLGPKEGVLRECRRLLRPGGRLAFTTIHVSDGLDRRRHREAVLAGPWCVATRRPYPELVARAGFADVRVHDLTRRYERTQRAWLEATEANADALRLVCGDDEFEVAQRDRRRTRAAIAAGLLRRILVTACGPVRPRGGAARW